MTKQTEYRQAIQMRKEGKSYSQIKEKLGLSKSTLSRWLNKMPLTQEQLKSIKLNEGRVEKFRETMKKKKDTQLYKYYQEQKRKILPLNDKELFIAGLFLYWGEGSKVTNNNMLSINNTDPTVLQFMLYWMIKILKISRSQIKVSLHLYNDMDVISETIHWSNILKLPRENFIKPYIKLTKRSDVDHKGYGHGTCALMVYNTVLKEKVMMAIKAVSDCYAEKINQI